MDKFYFEQSCNFTKSNTPVWVLFTFFKAYYLKQIIVRMVSLESSANGIIKLTFYFTYPDSWFLFNYRISCHWSPSILSENIRELLVF